MNERFRPCSLDQPFLMPPSLQDWVPPDHLARFIAQVVEQLDLQTMLQHYHRKDGRGAAGYHPVMLTRLLLYGYCIGLVSSRKMEAATYEDVAFRYLAADQHPDHDTIADFRRVHLEILGKLFVPGLALCREAGLVQVGRVMLDGTKMAAQASRRKSLEHEQLQRREEALQQKVEELLRTAEAADVAEEALYGKGRRGDELPAELADSQQWLERIREAKARLEQRLKQRAEEAEREREQQQASGAPASAAQKKSWSRARAAEAKREGTINLTDADSRVMKDGNRGGFVQGYNAQAAVLENQIIVALEVTDQAADKQQLVPMAAEVKKMLGNLPGLVADAGYFSEQAITDESLKEVELLIPPDHSKPGEPLKANASHSETAEKMREKLRSAEGAAAYRLRQQTIEPVFGQIKEARRFRRFSFRGMERVKAEWKLIGLGHNLLKLFPHRAKLGFWKAVPARI